MLEQLLVVLTIGDDLVVHGRAAAPFVLALVQLLTALRVGLTRLTLAWMVRWLELVLDEGAVVVAVALMLRRGERLLLRCLVQTRSFNFGEC